MQACYTFGSAFNELKIHDLVDPAAMSASSKVVVDENELHDPSDAQILTTFWKVKGRHYQVTDVPGKL